MKKPKRIQRQVGRSYDPADIQVRIEDAFEDSLLSVRETLENEGYYFDTNAWRKMSIRAAAALIHILTN